LASETSTVQQFQYKEAFFFIKKQTKFRTKT
jgi:hypothetical protein